ncbi:MAG TPA: sugar phosphate isomerase/epimerase family protein [Lacunisphaera sp.]|nr:sugar phosphate isomerase/epimerase family protein [Lacunisphaera sp.]
MPPPDLPPSRLRFGCCGCLVSPADPLGADIAEELAVLGYDYLELSLRDVAALPAAAFANLAARLQRAGMPCEACNNFFPPEIRLTGPAADLPAALGYAQAAFTRAQQLGVTVVVFGSSGARNVPAGFPPEAAWAQLRDLLVALGPLAEEHGITIVIEHLNRGESNILNLIADGARMAREVAHPRVQVLADAYHVRQENEDPAILATLGPSLRHVHVAQRAERLFPDGNDAALAAFFGELRATTYTGRCSIEAYTRDFSADAARALRVCRELTA